ncbi:hypothetical protein [Caryophanon tenue]|uniref:Uncharacterized protein n=1 Tax=Caryophanon tenue TaxID=33978 RepID=A0A1C0YMS3_9BACL|nr:hypothetical protein [Caryophanon tenue]OCS88476.1 hypothetical protein A6M13_01115 [Caryophanon tenue]
MEMKTKNNRVDLMSVREFVDEIVFNHIDTSNNYEQAYKALAPKLDEGLAYLKKYMQENNGELPKSNTYWTLYATLISKISYFTAFSMWKLQKGTVDEINTLFLASVYVLPNKATAVNEEILEDVSANYTVFQQEQQFDTVIDLHKEALNRNMTTADCLSYIVKHLL